MMEREETRNLETIPVGSLGIIPLRGCESLAQRVDQYLVRWRTRARERAQRQPCLCRLPA